MPTFKSINLGVVKTEQSTKDSNLLHYPLPAQDSADAILIDLMGVSRTINISGEKIGTKQQLIDWVASIEAIENGEQESEDYNGEIITGIKCQIQSFDWTYTQGDPTRVTYTLVLMEGDI